MIDYLTARTPEHPNACLPRNLGMPLELKWLCEVRVNRSAVERRLEHFLTGRYSVAHRHPMA